VKSTTKFGDASRSDDADGFALADEGGVEPERDVPMMVVPRLCTPIDDDAPDEWPLATVNGERPVLPAPVVGSPLPAVRASSADAPCFWRGLEVAAPMAELAQGTQPESEPEEVPRFWRLDVAAMPETTDSAQVSTPAPHEHFEDAERAFFAEGEELARHEQKVDEFLDLADKTLSFWQRLWRR